MIGLKDPGGGVNIGKWMWALVLAISWVFGGSLFWGSFAG